MHYTEKNDRARMEFFRLGVHYYAAGRFAALSQLIPVAGNLLHHAIEMFLKGALVQVVGLEALRNMRHDLNRIWGAFKQHFPVNEAAVLDMGVAELHRFERLRYPDAVISEGMEAHFALFRSHRADIAQKTGPEPRYMLVLEDVDDLASVVFKLASVNPPFYLNSLHAESKAILSRENLHSLM